MKTIPNHTLSTNQNVGDWDGQEENAAKQFNRIIFEIYSCVSENTSDDTIDDVKKMAWDFWGSNDNLLNVTDEQISEYVKSVI